MELIQLVLAKISSSSNFCPDGEDKKHQGLYSLQSKEVSVRYFAGKHCYVLPLLQISWMLVLMPNFQHDVLAWTQLCAHDHCSVLGLELHPVTLAPEKVNFDLQDTMRTYLGILGSQTVGLDCIQLVEAHGLAQSDLFLVFSFPEQVSGPSL